MNQPVEYEITSDELTPRDLSVDRDRYIRAIENFEISHLLSFHFSGQAESRLKEVISTMLARHARESHMGTIFHLLKELIINAAKANFKSAAHKLNQEQREEFSLEKFKEMLKADSDAYKLLKSKSKELGLWIKIKALIDEDGAYFLIKNNTLLSPTDNEKIRKKLEKAMTYDSLADFYMAQAMEGGEQEGAGIGFAMIITALKGMGLDGKYLTVGLENDATVARLHIPFAALDKAS
ncbi:MAG: hypothetical protein HS115_10460 [Spirochaetales bacterium]|nr:hypothetical protein [Spirochaetales bacterium]